MRRRPIRQPVALPLLDRLIDENPSQKTDAPAPDALDELANEKVIREMIGRDLEVLLNTRQRLVQPPGGEPELSQSILDFGLPQMRGTNLATQSGRVEFGRTIEAAIRCFEPRLRDVQVSVDAGVTPLDPLKVVIAGKLVAGLEPDPFQIEGSVAAGTGRFDLVEGGS